MAKEIFWKVGSVDAVLKRRQCISPSQNTSLDLKRVFGMKTLSCTARVGKDTENGPTDQKFPMGNDVGH